MSDYFDEPDEPDPGARRQPPRRPPAVRRRRPGPLVTTLVVLVVVIVGFSIFTRIWTEKLWFSSIDYSSVFTTLVWTRVGLFVVFGVLMMVIVGVNIVLAFRLRPLFRAHTPEQAGLDRYREVVLPIRRVLLIGVSVVFGLFAGASAEGKWRIYLLWKDRTPFGRADPYFGKDIGFYVFSLPWLHYLVDFTMTAVVFALLAALVVHYLFGGIRLQTAEKFTGAAQAHVSILLGVFMLLKACDYWLDRFDLTSRSGGVVTGMTYTRDHAVLPSKNILLAIAVICALLFFANAVRRTWLLPGVGVGLFVLSAVLLGMVWPAIVQKFQVDPSVADKEAPYISQNIRATRTAYDVADSTVTDYNATSTLSQAKLKTDAASLPGIRLLDPQVVSESFEQLQQVKGYYSVPSVLDVDRYQVDGRERDMVVAARELNLSGLPDGQQNWTNEHTVYTHGYGLIAAYGNQRDAADKPVTDNKGDPVFSEYDLPPVGQLGKYVGQIYYGEQSPEYSIVGHPKGGKNVELDLPQGSSGSDNASTTMYTGPGVKIGSAFRQLLYAVKFQDANILLSSRVNKDSKILYDRSPRQRVQEVAPWLTVDSDALPTVVDGRLVWLVDGYTTTDKYPLSEKRSLREMVSDSLNPRAPFATLPTDQINYMRNSVKAVVDAYTGKVTLYAWDSSDPILKTWEKVFPGVVKPKSDIPQDLLEHMRYPEDLYKVQRNILAQYHVTDPRTFYSGSDRWDVPQDPNHSTNKQPPYRLSVATKSGENPVFSLTSVYVPNKRQNLAAFMSVGADPTDPSTYGKFQILQLPDNTQVAGPSQIANQFDNDPDVADKLLAFKRTSANTVPGNLLTLPVGGGLLYVEPMYTIRSGGTGTYPQLKFVLVSFGKSVGIGDTLTAALDDVLGVPSSSGSGSSTSSGSSGSTSTQKLPATALKLLQQADAKFKEAQTRLKAGDLTGYARAVKQAQALVQQALADGSKATSSSGSKK